MEQHNQEIGTRRDLVLYRLETARNDLKSARQKRFAMQAIMMTFILQVKKNRNGRFQSQMNS